MNTITLPDPPELGLTLARLKLHGTAEERLGGVVQAHANLTAYLAEIGRTYDSFAKRLEDCRARKAAAEAEIAAIGSALQQIAGLILACHPPTHNPPATDTATTTDGAPAGPASLVPDEFRPPDAGASL